MNPERQRTREGVLFLVLFALTIPAANWLIGHVGTTCVPQGPCLVPVAPGLMAPSGVTMVGIALVLRDLVQRRLGTAISALAVLVGSGLSALYAPASLVRRIGERLSALRIGRPCGLHAVGAAAVGGGRYRFKLRRLGGRLDCVLMARFRLA